MSTNNDPPPGQPAGQPPGQPTPEIELGPETEGPQGWTYDDTRVFFAGKLQTLSIRLSFADYDHWSRGALSPSRVTERALLFAVVHWPETQLPQRIDCATLRRRFPEIDQAVTSPS